MLTIIKTGYVIALSFFYSNIVYAATGRNITGGFENPVPSVGTIPVFIAKILDIAVQIGVPIAVLAIVYSGFLFLVAQGKPEKLEKAKRAFLWSLVGAFVLLGAKVFAIAISGTIGQL